MSSQGDFATLGNWGTEIVDVVPVPCFLIDSNGIFVAGNKAFYEFVEGESSQYIGKNGYFFLMSESQEKLKNSDQELRHGAESCSDEAKVCKSADEIKTVVIKRSLVANSSSNKEYILASMLDMTGFLKEKDTLLKLQSEKQALLEGFPGIICQFDMNRRLLRGNPNISGMVDEPVGKSCHEIFGCSEDACEFCGVLDGITSGAVLKSRREVVLTSQKGEEKIYEISGTPVKDPEGRVYSVLVIGRDVTENNTLEKQLRHTQKMEAIGTLAGGIAHDFNNVLTPIMGYSEILRLKLSQQGNEGELVQEYLDGILSAAKRAKNLVEQVLTFSRSSEHKASIQHLHPIVKEVMKLVRNTLPSTITIKQDIDESCGVVFVDPVQIHQILINLCSNSDHAMAGGHGTLTVTLAPETSHDEKGEWIRLSVEDTGKGLSEEIKERIFEPYFTTKEKEQGTGMGLALTHGVVKRMGGRIEVFSEKGKGTRFDLFFPVSKNATTLDSVVSTSELVEGEGRILLVDDEAQVVQVTGALLTSLGYEVTGSASAHDALSMFTENPHGFDLLLTDLTMPELTGVELSRKVKSIRPEIPVILFTGYSDTLVREEAEEAGISKFCMKPVSLKELSSVVYNSLSEKIT